MISDPQAEIAAIHAEVAAMGDHLSRNLAEGKAYCKKHDRMRAESERLRTRKLVSQMVASTPEGRIAAAKAAASAVHAQINEIAAQGDLQALDSQAPGERPSRVADVRIDDLHSLFSMRDKLLEWLRERIETIYAKINWQTRKGKKGYFNVAVNDNGIPIDKALTILAHLHDIVDGTGEKDLNHRVDAVIECGLYPKIKKGKFAYSRRCQDEEHCELCNWVNISAGLKELLVGYSESAFYDGGNWFAITVAPRTNRKLAKAAGRTLIPEDWQRENPESAVFRESYLPRAFKFPDPFLDHDWADWDTCSDIRYFLGAVQSVLGKMVKNGWLDGIRAKVENSIEFLPFKSHQHWHGVGSSRCEHDPQKMADFIYTEINAILAKTCPGLYADVLVAVISTPEDLQQWITYITKTVDLVGAVESVYNRHPGLRETDPLFRQFYQELQLYPARSRAVFGMIRHTLTDERGKHTHRLQRNYVRGNHKFGKGSILSESKRHRLWRKANAKRVKVTRQESRREAKRTEKKLTKDRAKAATRFREQEGQN